MKKRIDITVDEELLTQIDTYCLQIGTTRSAFIVNACMRELKNFNDNDNTKILLAKLCGLQEEFTQLSKEILQSSK